MDLLTEEELDLLEPAPDIHALFLHYNELYFESKLGACSVEWSSSRMTSCGGTCELVGGGAGGARIKLSEPLLKLRPTRDLKEVLLHEMTHAYMMLQGIRDDDRGGHGTIFKSIIRRINTSRLPDHQRPPGGYNVAVYHTMLAEVDHYRQHHWQCERCGNLVKRAMNRPPQEADCWGRMGRGASCRDPECRFHMHLKHCGGAWIKIKEPEGYQQKGKKRGGSSSTADSNSSSASNPGGSRGGAGAASTGARPDGAPLPAKRLKKGSSGLPASAAAGTRAITDFFGSERGSGKQAAAGEAAAAAPEVLPSLKAVPGAAPAAAHAAQEGQPVAPQKQQQQAQQQQQGQQAQQQRVAERPEPSVEERRRLMAEAALRRLAGPGGDSRQPGISLHQQGQQLQEQQQQEPQREQQQELQRQQLQEQPAAGGRAEQLPPPQQQQQSPRQRRQQQEGLKQEEPQRRRQQHVQGQRRLPRSAQDVIDLLDSPPQAAAGGQQWAGGAQRQQGAEDALGSQPADMSPAVKGGSASSGSPGACLECPVCGRQWASAAINNAELNVHIDECLNASFL